MLAVVICNLCAVAMLLGLIGGIVAGFVQARVAIRDALACGPRDVVPLAEVRRSAARPVRWSPA